MDSNYKLAEPILDNAAPRSTHCSGKALALVSLLIGLSFAVLSTLVPGTHGRGEAAMNMAFANLQKPMGTRQFRSVSSLQSAKPAVAWTPLTPCPLTIKMTLPAQSARASMNPEVQGAPEVQQSLKIQDTPGDAATALTKQALAKEADQRAREIKYYEFTQVNEAEILGQVRDAVDAGIEILAKGGSADEKLNALLSDSKMQTMLINFSRLPAFSKEMGRAFQNDLDMLRTLKQVKYFWNLPKSQLTILLDQLAVQTSGAEKAESFAQLEKEMAATPDHMEKIKDIARSLPSEVLAKYRENADYLEEADPHAVYPTSIYRTCDALTLATSDTIEAVMSTSITTTIKITRNVLDPTNRLLYDMYKPLGRCVAVIDDKVEKLYGTQIDNYFATHGIEYVKLQYSGNEADKDIRDVERILVDLKGHAVARNEPLLVIGGGVIADIAGLAASLYSRNTPYVMLTTSIVSGIDAGPSPRVCCNGFDYKNLYGAYHPPVLTLTDRGMWKTLHHGWLRHGIAEIIKMAVVEDKSLFELLEKWGATLVHTKFGTEGDSVNDPAFQDEMDLIVGKAMEGYVRSEYGNLWETHQCRPHAYGHTWSPGYELPAGMLHGHAVATCMGYGAYLSHLDGMISENEMNRIHKTISDCELSLWHPIMDDHDMVWKSHLAMIEKRGGNLCAPVPKPLGQCGYINDLTREGLDKTMDEYKVIASKYPRNGMGVDPHCTDVGLEDPQAKKANHAGAPK